MALTTSPSPAASRGRGEQNSPSPVACDGRRGWGMRASFRLPCDTCTTCTIIQHQCAAWQTIKRCRPIHTDGPTSHVDRSLPSLGRRSDTARAQLDPHRLAVDDPRYRMEVRVKAAACMSLREADRIAEGWAFVTLSAFGHRQVPPQAKNVSSGKMCACTTKAAVPGGGERLLQTALYHSRPHHAIVHSLVCERYSPMRIA